MATILSECGPQTAAQAAPSPDRERDGARLPVWFVGACWLVMLGLSLFIVWKWGYNLPYIDDFNFTPYLCGEEKLNWQFLWSQNNEHRIPVPRLLYMGLVLLGGGDFRTPMYFNVLAMGGLTLGLMVAVNRLRGRTWYTDALFPLTGLGAAHTEPFLWGMEIQFICSVLLAGTLLCLICRNRSRLSLGAMALAGTALVLLPLCGANGLGLVPALALWFGYVGFRELRSPERGRKVTGVIAGCAALGSLALIAYYFIGYQSINTFPHPSSVKRLFTAAGQLLANSLGPIARATWPYSGVLASGLVVASGLVLLLRACWAPAERLRTLGLLLFLGAMGSVVLGMAWGRAEYPTGYTFERRYGILMVPALWAVFCTGVACHRAWAGRLFQIGLLVGAVVLVPVNWRAGGLDFARWHAQQVQGFHEQVAAGLPVRVLARRYTCVLYPFPELFEQFLTSMHAAGLGDLRELRGNEELAHLREEPAALSVSDMNQMSWDGHQGQILGSNPILVFKLKEACYVSGLRFKVAFQKPPQGGGLAFLRAFWKTSGGPEICEKYCQREQIPVDSADHEITIWVWGRMDSLVLLPGASAGEFRISAMTLLTPGRATGDIAQAR